MAGNDLFETPQIPCGSEPAREEAGTSDIEVGWQTAFVGTPPGAGSLPQGSGDDLADGEQQ